jgi:hypothetical protein
MAVREDWGAYRTTIGNIGFSVLDAFMVAAEMADPRCISQAQMIRPQGVVRLEC